MVDPGLGLLLGSIQLLEMIGIDIPELFGSMCEAASKARAHKRRCEQFTQRLMLILKVLEPLNASKLRKDPEMIELLKKLNDVLQRGYGLIVACKDRPFICLLFKARSIEHRFDQLDREMDGFLAVVPLVSLAITARKETVGNMEAATVLPPYLQQNTTLADGGGGEEDSGGLSVPYPAPCGSGPSAPYPAPCNYYYGGSPCMLYSTLHDGVGYCSSEPNTTGQHHQYTQEPLFPPHMVFSDENPNAACSIM